MSKELNPQGLKTRREVLGAEYVDAAIANADDFSRPLQEWVTETAWNGIWNRPGLDRHTDQEVSPLCEQPLATRRTLPKRLHNACGIAFQGFAQSSCFSLAFLIPFRTGICGDFGQFDQPIHFKNLRSFDSHRSNDRLLDVERLILVSG